MEKEYLLGKSSIIALTLNLLGFINDFHQQNKRRHLETI